MCNTLARADYKMERGLKPLKSFEQQNQPKYVVYCESYRKEVVCPSTSEGRTLYTYSTLLYSTLGLIQRVLIILRVHAHKSEGLVPRHVVPYCRVGTLCVSEYSDARALLCMLQRQLIAMSYRT